MIHPDGCTATDTITVNVIDPDTLDCTRIFIPNAFTPGFSSGRNDRFFISNPFAISEFISFEVFDRWGGRVFNAESVTDSWDGTFAGNPVNTGIFLYRLRYRCKGEEKVLSGTVTLLR
jgi:gliding motility-associated-like protein